MIGKCDTCNGSGHVGYEPCTDCFATGEVPAGPTPVEFDQGCAEWLRKHRPEREV